MKKFAWIPLLALVFASCTKSEPSEKYLIFKFKFSDTIPRLNDTGAIAIVPPGNAAASPTFNWISSHYVEIAESDSTPLGMGSVLYVGALKDSAIDFSQSIITKDGETFLAVPLSSIKPGTYKWLRVSLAYQNYNVPYRLDTVVSGMPFYSVYSGTIASFVGYNTYIKDYTISQQKVTVNGKRRQGYWGFETTVGANGITFSPVTKTGQAPDSATTVVNPLFATSPIPKGSCVVTAKFQKANYIKTNDSTTVSTNALVITGKETGSITVECNMSTNKSFEWRDNNGDGAWQPLKGEQVIDMGIRGMKPVIR